MREDNLIPPETTPVLEPLPSKSKFKIPPVALGLLIGVLITSSVFAAYEFIYKPTQTPQAVIVPTSIPIPTIEPTSVTESGEYGQITWITPVKVANPDILRKENDPGFPGYYPSDLGTYHVGNFASKEKLLIFFVQPEGPSSPYVFRLVSHEGKYSVIESFVDNEYIKNDLTKIFRSDVKIIAYPYLKLNPPATISGPDTQPFVSASTFMSTSLFSELKNPQKSISTTSGDLYSVLTTPYENSTNIFGRELYLKLADSTLKTYRPYLSFVSEDRVPQVTLNGVANAQQYEMGIPFKCGLGAATTIIKNNSPLLLDKQEVGYVTNQSSQKIYQVKNVSNEIVRTLYNSYKLGRDYPSAPPILNIDQFNETSTHFLYQDYSGDWILFVSSQFAPAVECGKPVIYLYPPKDTEVSVKVAADITKSEPLYPQNGWTVLAHPNGQMDYQGTSYPNLFWEGLGYGNYPNIGNSGFVVTQNKLISTIKEHLTLLGLNSTEQKDFLEFWTDKLPKTPYVRLTWINTSGMNQLAPLSVSPQPDTVIRIFLDFEGLEKPISLVPQKLSSIPRLGFTLVEWGGLLFQR